MTPTDEQRALAEKLVKTDFECWPSLLAESEAKATAVIRGKADECWGAANYRLKYLGMLFRALNMTEDGIEGRISEACSKISDLNQSKQILLRCVNDLLSAHEAVYHEERWACMEQAVERTKRGIASILDETHETERIAGHNQGRPGGVSQDEPNPYNSIE